MPVVTYLNPSGGVIDPAVDSNFQVVTSGPNATFFYTTTLTFLRNTTVADEGIYTCRASNGFDTTTDQAMLTVNGKTQSNNIICYMLHWQCVLTCRSVTLSC